MAVTPEMILSVRREVADLDPALPILADSEYEYFLTKQSESIRKASLDAAKTILFKLSINASERSIDILSVKGRFAAQAYMEALKLYLKDPNLNGLYQFVNLYASGISKKDMKDNQMNVDNNYVAPPDQLKLVPTTNPFMVDGIAYSNYFP